MGSIGKRVRQMSLLLVVRPHRAQSIPPAFFLRPIDSDATSSAAKPIPGRVPAPNFGINAA